MSTGLIWAHTAAPPQLSSVGNCQVVARVGQRRVGGVVIFFYAFLEQTVVRKLLLDKMNK